MQTSRRRRCTRRSLPSTPARSTKKPIRARDKRGLPFAAQGRLGIGAALLLCALIVAACSGSKTTPPQPTLPPAETAVPSPTPPPPPRDLASQIGVRADLPAFDPVDLAARYGNGVQPQRSKPFAGEANVGDHRPLQVFELSGAVLAHSG